MQNMGSRRIRLTDSNRHLEKAEKEDCGSGGYEPDPTFERKEKNPDPADKKNQVWIKPSKNNQDPDLDPTY